MGTSDPEKVVDEIFVRMDLDGNGTLSKHEFIIGGQFSTHCKFLSYHWLPSFLGPEVLNQGPWSRVGENEVKLKA